MFMFKLIIGKSYGIIVIGFDNFSLFFGIEENVRF